jgi:hypothetical protein
MVSLTWIFQASLAATTVGHSPIRLLIVYDKQSNGVAPSTLDVVTIDEIDSLMNLNNSRRFKILADEVYEQGLSTAGPGALITKGFRDFTGKGRRRGLDVEFRDTNAGDITDIITGSIYSFIWQNGGLITASPTNSFYTRIRFIDP